MGCCICVNNGACECVRVCVCVCHLWLAAALVVYLLCIGHLPLHTQYALLLTKRLRLPYAFSATIGFRQKNDKKKKEGTNKIKIGKKCAKLLLQFFPLIGIFSDFLFFFLSFTD